ncbi:MAG: ERCC4 domain-containing protein [Nanoarchaeota archaeon]|nr:ERCC4 domain-containing protein [Nanoarchaeota archaeon]
MTKDQLSITIDTREQSPLEFNKPYIKEVTTSKLEYGDYSARLGNKICPMFFERKSLSDLFGTLGKGNARFRAEIKRCFSDNNQLTIIVEKPLDRIYKGYKFSQMSGQQIGRTLFTLFLKYDIKFVCCKNRAEMELYIAEYYYSWAKNLDFLDDKINA